MEMNKGITMIEMMVTIAIMAVMVAAVFFNWRPAESSFALNRSAHQLAGDLRRAQQLSISTRVFSCAGQDADFSGYGVYLNKTNKNSYHLFENCTANYLYSSGESLSQPRLEEGVEIKSITITGPSGSSGQASIVFVPPDPKVFIQGQGFGHEAVIVLGLAGGEEKQVKINNAGRIEVE